MEPVKKKSFFSGLTKNTFLLAFTSLFSDISSEMLMVLMAGGVVGAQFGVHTGHKIRPERLRLMLGLLVFAVGVRFAYELVVTPDDLYSLRHVSSE